MAIRLILVCVAVLAVVGVLSGLDSANRGSCRFDGYSDNSAGDDNN